MGRNKGNNLKPLVMIDWQDAYVTTDEDPSLDKEVSHLTRSVGWEVKKDRDFVYLSHFLDGISGSFGSPWTLIPIKMIKERWEIELDE